MNKIKPLPDIFITFINGLMFAFFIGTSLLPNSIGSNLAKSYLLSPEKLGSIVSSIYSGNIFFLIPSGILLDKYSPKNLCSFAVLICSAALYAISISNSEISLYVLFFLMGASGAFSFTGSMKIIVGFSKTDKKTLLIGTTVAMGMLGALLAQAPLTAVSDCIGWKNSILIVSCIGFLIAFFCFIFLPKKSLNKTSPPSPGRLKDILLKPQNWGIGLFTSAMGIPMYIFGGLWGIFYITNVYHYNDYKAACLISTMFIGSILGAPTVGLISRKILSRHLIIFSGIASCALMLGIDYLTSFPFWLLLVLFASFGFIQIFQVVGYSFLETANKTSDIAKATSLVSILNMLGPAIAQPIFGAICFKTSDVGSSKIYEIENHHYAILFLIAIVLFSIIAILLAFRKKESVLK